MKGLIYFSLLFAGCLADDLVTLSSKRVTDSQCCGGDHVLSCNLANVQLENLGTEEVNLPGDLTLNFLNNVNGNQNTYYYGSDDGEAVVTYNPNSNGLHGHALSSDGKFYNLEFCGSSGHVWKLLDTENISGDLGLELPTNRLALELPILSLIPDYGPPIIDYPEYPESISRPELQPVLLTTAPVGVPVTVAPAITAPVGEPVTDIFEPTTTTTTTAPATTAPVGVPVTVASATTAPIGVPVTVAPATTAPVGVPVTVAPATTAPVGVPVTVAPVKFPVMCNYKKAKSLRTMKKLKNVKSTKLCQKECQDKSIKGCVAFNHNKKKKTCQLLKLTYYKTKFFCSGSLPQNPNFPLIRYNKQAISLKKVWTFGFCQDKCQIKSGCVAWNVFTMDMTCQLLILVVKKKNGTNTGRPYKL